MGILTVLLTLIYTGVCVFLILVILLQAGKGGGLSGLMGGGGLADSLGATGAEKTLNRWTTYCAVAFFVLSVVLTVVGGRIARQNILTGVSAPSAQTTQTAPPTATAPETTSPVATGEQAASPETKPAGPPAVSSSPAPEAAPAPGNEGPAPALPSESNAPPPAQMPANP
ncbi:MAG: preprotein translocase subunit SecG [bacterium]